MRDVHYDPAIHDGGYATRAASAQPACGNGLAELATAATAWVTCPACADLMPASACPCWYRTPLGHVGHCCIAETPDDYPELTPPPCGHLPDLEALDLLAVGDTDEAAQAGRVAARVREWRADRNAAIYQQDDLLGVLDDLTQGASPERSTR